MCIRDSVSTLKSSLLVELQRRATRNFWVLFRSKMSRFFRSQPIEILGILKSFFVYFCVEFVLSIGVSILLVGVIVLQGIKHDILDAFVVTHHKHCCIKFFLRKWRFCKIFVFFIGPVIRYKGIFVFEIHCLCLLHIDNFKCSFMRCNVFI